MYTSVYQSCCISVGAHLVFWQLTFQAKTKALSLIFSIFPDHGSFQIDYVLTEPS